MGMFRTLLLGRENGLRSKVREMVLGSTPDTSPDSAYSAPSYEPPPAPASTFASAVEPPRDVTPPEGFEVVLHVDSLRPGEVAEVIAGGTAICVANVSGEYYAIANNCPHGDGPLGEGALTGKMVACPYHGWSFDVTTGECQTNASASVESFEVRLKDAAVCVRL